RKPRTARRLSRTPHFLRSFPAAADLELHSTLRRLDDTKSSLFQPSSESHDTAFVLPAVRRRGRLPEAGFLRAAVFAAVSRPSSGRGRPRRIIRRSAKKIVSGRDAMPHRG